MGDKLKKIKKLLVIFLCCIICFNTVACSLIDSDDDYDDDFEEEERTEKRSGENKKESKYDLEEFDIEAACGECKGCKEALTLYYALINKAVEYSKQESMERYDLELFVNYYIPLHEALDHKCKAETIYVEDVPYAYYYSLGNYTGEWKGAGPTGKGVYIGNSFGIDSVVKYDGDWVWGLPEGKGYLYYENFKWLGWDMNYNGEMMCGKRHGTGVMFEYRMHQYIEDFHNYRFYEEAVFENDIMVSEPRYENYNADRGELVSWGYATGAENGWIYILEEHHPEDELSATDIAFLVAGSAITWYIINGLFDMAIDTSYTPMTSEEMGRILMEHQESKKAEYTQIQEYEKRKNAEYCQRKYDEQKDWHPEDRSEYFEYWEYNRYYNGKPAY